MARHRDLFEEKAYAGLPIDHVTVIDSHGHVGREHAGFSCLYQRPEDLLRTMDRVGVAIACVSGMEGVQGDYEAGNAQVKAALTAYPDRFYGYMFVRLQPSSEAMKTEIERRLEEGFKGVKIHSSSTAIPYNHEYYQELFDLADRFGLPILAHTWGEKYLKDLEPAIQRCRKVNWIFGHSGANDRELYAEFALKYPNVFLETCYSRAPRGLIEYFMSMALYDKTLWGSDATFLGVESQIGRVLFAEISEEHKKRVLGENAKNALKIR